MQTKKKQATTLKPYIQGRYRCIACGEFDEVQLGNNPMPSHRVCPVCTYDAVLLTTARGMALNPPVGLTLPGYMERRLGQVEKESRGVRTRVGYHKRKHQDCSLCSADTYTKTGAIDHAEDMRRQHMKQYEIFPCPFGPGYHVTVMED
jgi:hypothetical protein